MKSLLMRLLLVIIAIPAIICAILFVQDYNFAALSIGIVIFAGIAAYELAKIINAKTTIIDAASSTAVSSITTLLIYLFSIEILNIKILSILIFLIFIFQISTVIFRSKNNFENSVVSAGAYIFSFIYTGILPGILIMIGTLKFAVAGWFIFFALVFSNDTFAYIFGMLLGRWTPKPFKVSPNKSLAGFAGGLAGTIGAAVAAFYIEPEFFNSNISNIFFPAAGIFLLGTAGDLFESALKRGAGIKDSGKIMLGRGGVLDSIDSILFTAPFFYIIMTIIQG